MNNLGKPNWPEAQFDLLWHNVTVRHTLTHTALIGSAHLE
jgi:hypothetical protein